MSVFEKGNISGLPNALFIKFQNYYVAVVFKNL